MQLVRIVAATLVAALTAIASPAAAQVTGNGGFDAPMSALTDQAFIEKFVEANNQEILQAAAQLHSRDAGVRLFARTMIADHTSANVQGEAIARNLGLQVPHAILSEGAAVPVPPASSARSYMTEQVTNHEAVIAVLRQESKFGSNAQLKTLAMHVLLVAQAHLAMAQQYLSSGTVSPEVVPTPPQN